MHPYVHTYIHGFIRFLDFGVPEHVLVGGAVRLQAVGRAVAAVRLIWMPNILINVVLNSWQRQIGSSLMTAESSAQHAASGGALPLPVTYEKQSPRDVRDVKQSDEDDGASLNGDGPGDITRRKKKKEEERCQKVLLKRQNQSRFIRKFGNKMHEIARKQKCGW